METFVITITLFVSVVCFIIIILGVFHNTTPEERKRFGEKFCQWEKNNWDTYNENESPSTPGTAAWMMNEDDK